MWLFSVITLVLCIVAMFYVAIGSLWADPRRRDIKENRPEALESRENTD